MPPPARRAPFVGRERELETLSRRLDEARRGDAGVALIAGEPGIGKTRLLSEFAARAQNLGWTVLTGRAYETAGMPPYLPFIDALREYTANRSAEELRSALSSGAVEVERLLPHLRNLISDESAPQVLGVDQERFRLFDGVTAALFGIARASESGLVLVLDDLHWADASSLALLQHLVARMVDGPFYLTLGYRSSDPTVGGPLQAALAAINRSGIASHLQLKGFTPVETAALLSGLTGMHPAPEVVAAIVAATEGSPFFVGELARHLQVLDWDLADPGLAALPLGVPAGVRQVVVSRLDRLSQQVKGALHVAAVLNDGFTFEVLQRASGLDATAVLDVIDVALAGGFLQEQGAGFAFTHALIRQAVYEDLSLPRRQRLHFLAGEALEAAYLGRLATIVPAIATHFRLAGATAGQQKALQYTIQAAMQARTVFAFREAARLLEEALEIQVVLNPGDLAARCDLLLMLGETMVPAGEPQRVAEEVAGEALSLAELLGDRIRAARACDLATVAYFRYVGAGAANLSRYRTWAEAAAKYATPDTPAQVRAHVALAEALRFGDYAARRQCSELVRTALIRARQLNDPESLSVAASALISNALLADVPSALVVAEEMARRPHDGCSTTVSARILYVTYTTLLDWGKQEAAARALVQLRELGERTNDAYARLSVMMASSCPLNFAGRFDEALEAARGLLDLGAALGMLPLARQWSLGLSVVPLLARGRYAELLAGHSAYRDAVGVNHPVWYWTLVAMARLGRFDEARAGLDLELLTLGDADEFWHTQRLSSLLETAILVGDLTTTASIATTLEPALANASVRSSNGMITRLLGDAALALGNRVEALSYYEQALAVGGKVGFRSEIALTRLALARTLWDGDARERNEANSHLLFVIPEFETLGMQPALSTAFALRAEIGVGSVEQADRIKEVERRYRHPDGLTPGQFEVLKLVAVENRAGAGTPSNHGSLSEREAQVLRLVAEGKTNGEIAAVLVLSIRTVERHISTVYGKIGASGPTARMAAGAYARKHGLDAPAGALPRS